MKLHSSLLSDEYFFLKEFSKTDHSRCPVRVIKNSAATGRKRGPATDGMGPRRVQCDRNLANKLEKSKTKLDTLF